MSPGDQIWKQSPGSVAKQPACFCAEGINSEDDGARTRNLRRDRPGCREARSPPCLLLVKDLRRFWWSSCFQILPGIAKSC